MKVDPEQLEREAEELQKQFAEALAEPEVDTDTPQEPEADDNAPSEPEDTAEDGNDEAPLEEDRGDPNSSDSDLEQKLKVAEERVKNAQARMTKATQEAAELRREVAELKSTVASLQSQLASAATRQDEVDDELAKLSEEYPDIAQPLLKKLSKLEETVTEYRTRIEADKGKASLEAHFATIRESHPDMDEIVTSDDFTGWIERQSPLWQRVATDGSAAEVVELLDRYKEAMGTSPQQKAPAVERARKVAEPALPKARKPDPNAGKRIWTRDEIRRMSLDDFEKHQADIDRAYLEGRVR